MLSRLSGIANTVLHELSGDGDAGEAESANTEPVPETGVENMVSEDVLARLAHTEQLVVQMKELIRDKDAQLQQKEAALKEEKDLGDAKLAKLKLQAKAKMASLNKQIDELKKAAPGMPAEPQQSPGQLSGEHSFHEEQQEELKALKLNLQEKEGLCRELQETVTSLKEQLESTNMSLKQAEAQHAEQLSSLQQVIQEKDSRFQEQVHRHEEELLQVAAQSNAGAEMQQALKALQRKEEEQEEALLARARVVEMLQQELENADHQKQILSQQLRKMEDEARSLKVELDTERQASKTMVEKSEVDMKEKEQLFHQLQGEMQSLKEQLEEAKRVCANVESERNIQEQKYGEEVQNLKEQLEEAETVHVELKSERELQDRKHSEEVQSLKKQLEEAETVHAELKSERELQDQHREEVQSLKKQLEETETVHVELKSERELQDQKHREEVQSLKEQLEEARRVQAETESEKNVQDQMHRGDMQNLKEKLKKVITTEQELQENSQKIVDHGEVNLEEKESSSQMVLEQEVILLQGKVMELEEEKKNLIVHVADLEEVKAENVMLNSRLSLLESQYKGVGAAEELLQVGTAELVQHCETSRPGFEGDLLLNVTTYRTKELSILMMDLQDAQEEISKLKGQLQDRGGRWVETEVESSPEGQMEEVANQQKVETETDSVVYPATSKVETMEEKQASLLQYERGTSLMDVEMPESTMSEEKNGVFHLEQVLCSSEELQARQGLGEENTFIAPDVNTSQDQESHRLQRHIPDPQIVEGFFRQDMEKEMDKYQLNMSVLECQTINEDSKKASHGMTIGECLISQVRDTSAVSELKEQVRKLKDDVSDVEKQRMSDYENMSMQQSMLGEQIISLENESKSKDLKIKALQKDLDQIQLQFSEQETLLKHLKNQLQEKEKEVFGLEEHLRKGSLKMEELAQKIASKETETAMVEQQLSEKSKTMEVLKQSVLEKDQQAAEISHSMSEKIVQLNEEKHTLREEIKRLKEHAISLQKNEERNGHKTENFSENERSFLQKELPQLKEIKDVLEKEEEPQEQLQQGHEMMEINEKEALLGQLEAIRHNQVQQDKRIMMLQKEKEELQVQLEAMRHVQCRQEGDVSDKLVVEKEELHSLLEHQKKENEQLKRKLQAALINRKELMKKVDRLKTEVVLLQRGSEENASTREGDGHEPAKVHTEEHKTCTIQETEISLNYLLSDKELELQKSKDLAKQAASEEQLQALIKEMTLDLQDKTDLIKSLEAEARENKTVIQKLTTCNQSTEDAGLTVTNDPVASDGQKEHQQMDMQRRISSLEQENEQLQKKVQEALLSRKDTIKKAQEKDRHHREQLKQQKEDYNLLQEKFDDQTRNQVSIQEHLRELQRELEQYRESQGTLSGINETVVCLQSSNEQASSLTSQPQVTSQDSGWGQEWVEVSSSEIEDTFRDDNFLKFKDVSQELPREQLEKLQAEKQELELKASSVQNDLALKSDEVLHLKKHITEMVSEVENLKMRCDKAETSVSSLTFDLERSQAEVLSLSDLKDLKPQVEELRNLVSIKSEAAELLSTQLREKNDSLDNMQKVVLEKEDLINALQTQLESQVKEYEEKSKMFQIKVVELQQKQEEEAEEVKSNHQMQRKLQAALISRKEALKETKSLKEDLVAARATIDDLTNKLMNVEHSMSDLATQNNTLLKTITNLKEEREKLIAEVDKALIENRNLDASCESLKLALEGITQDKENIEKERECLRNSQDTERSEYQDKYKDLQKEYDMLLQSYENVSNETDRMQRAIETVRQEKQELFSKMKNVEAEKRVVEKQLQETEQEIEGMKEKMRKFAKSKQQKILELEEENERLRTELQDNGAEDSSASEKSKSNEELERMKSEYDSILHQLTVTKTENDSLSQELKDLKHQLQTAESKLKESVEAAEKKQIDLAQEVMIEAKQAIGTEADPEKLTEEQTCKDVSPESSDPSTVQKELKPTEFISHDEINIYIQQVNQLKEQVSELEKKKKAMEEEISIIKADFQNVGEEKNALQSQLTVKCSELKALQEAVNGMELDNKHYKDELVKMTRLKETLEAEKDDLEERLMNQLAELNGSIGNYQQDATDFQTKNDSLESELQSLQRKICSLEEEKRQLEREKAEAESKIQKEYSEKLKSAHKEEKGRKTHTKELQELLKEKQQEVKQLQKDCIRYQEKISGLERTVKALEFVQNESQKEQEAAKEIQAKAIEDRKKAQVELASFRVILDDTQSEAARVLADSLKLKEELQAHKESVSSQMKKKDQELEKKIEQEKIKHVKELKNVQEKLEVVQREKDHMEATIGDLQDSLHSKNQEAKQLQGSLNEKLAKLAAFTRSMSSLQDDRDRVIDETKKWETKFTDAIQKKEEEIRAKEEMCIVLKDQVKQMSIHVEELRIKVSRLEHEKQDWELKLQTNVQSHQRALETLQEEIQGLQSQLNESCTLHSNCQKDVMKLAEEDKKLRVLLEEMTLSYSKSEKMREDKETTVKKQEAQLQEYKFSCEQLQADLLTSKELINKLHEEIGAKDQKIISLLAAKEEAVAANILELQQQNAEDVKELEDRLREKEEERGRLEAEREKLQGRLTSLTAKMKTMKEESKQLKASLDSFTKSMSSLQDDRDQVLGEYKQLEERHLNVILDKDQLIQEAASENNTLKEEIRSLLSKMDDINSENAKLAAELVRYREDLNHVITLKDSQQKQLLKVQLEQIHVLEDAKANMDGQLKDSQTVVEDLKQTINVLQQDKQKMTEEAETQKLCISQLNSDVMALKESNTVLELESQLKEKVQDIQRLNNNLSGLQKRIEELEEEIIHVKEEAANKVQVVEGKHEKELQSLKHDTGIMRSETETAEERVAELARDLMEMEQRLLTVTEENKDLKGQIQSFGKSMSSLQDSRDQTQEELTKLGKKYLTDLEVQHSTIQNLEKELAQLKEEHTSVVKERDSLSTDLTSLTSNLTEDSMSAQIDQLSRQLRSKDEEKTHLASELEAASTQLQSFSKAMASLQDERDRLLSELDKIKKLEDKKQQSTLSSPAEIQSLKNALSSLQNDRDRLLKELKNLQEQYLRIGEETSDIARLNAQLQASQQQVEKERHLQEQLRLDNTFQQQELQQLREEKAFWESQGERLKEQYLTALADKDQHISDLQRLLHEMKSNFSKPKVINEQYQRQASSETASCTDAHQGDYAETGHLRSQLSDSLNQLHQKELRIQQLNSKLSHIYEEKNSLIIQLRGSSQNLRESNQRYSEVLAHCAALERQLQEQPQNKDMVTIMTDSAPGAPQEKNESQAETCPMDLKELQLRSNVWADNQDPEISSSHEHSLLIEPMEGTFSKPRSSSGLRRFLQYMFYSRTRTPLLLAVYFLVVHILLFLCFTGHL
ncbi:golgin subfamily B member 1 isoform X2 [Microcaecilia unicolor]|uniref:Golgin subfamily B member 1 isoform X2 n=1 Tax=Microcaecilia unicolor TaxID=1415580 RepID=A0A6P7Z613_9AMPH|nr:golgin subfamily B member 1 isoform X2 [Microcaecilia unicolor]